MAGWVSAYHTIDGDWHIDTYGAYDGSGTSWWMGTSNVGNKGGYRNNWYKVLDTPPNNLPNSSTTHTLTFDQKRAIEE